MPLVVGQSVQVGLRLAVGVLELQENGRQRRLLLSLAELVATAQRPMTAIRHWKRGPSRANALRRNETRTRRGGGGGALKCLPTFQMDYSATKLAHSLVVGQK